MWVFLTELWDSPMRFMKYFFQLIRLVQLDWVNGMFCHNGTTAPVVQFFATFQCCVSTEGIRCSSFWLSAGGPWAEKPSTFIFFLPVNLEGFLWGLYLSWWFAVVVYVKSTDDGDDLVVVFVVFIFFRLSFDYPHVVMISLILFRDFFSNFHLKACTQSSVEAVFWDGWTLRFKVSFPVFLYSPQKLS